MRMEGTRRVKLEFLSVFLRYQLFITDINPKRQLYFYTSKIVFIPYTNFHNFYFMRNILSSCSSIRYSRSLLSTSTLPASTAIITHVAAVVGPSIAAAAVAEIAEIAIFLASLSSFATIYVVVAAAMARHPKHTVHAIFLVPLIFIKKSLIPHSTSI